MPCAPPVTIITRSSSLPMAPPPASDRRDTTGNLQHTRFARHVKELVLDAILEGCIWPPEALPSPPGWIVVSGCGLGDSRAMRGGAAMWFFGVVTLTIALLQRQGRITYRALKRGFELDDAALEDLRRELIFRRLARDEAGARVGATVP